MSTLTVAEVSSPVGRIVAAVRGGRLVALEFAHRWPQRRARLEKRFGPCAAGPADDARDIVRRLESYFTGRLDALAPIAVDPGGTAFQRRVWSMLRRIPPGRTMSYRELARAIGAPAAVRAVGTANGANPIAIVIPCHRVIAADGRLSGYTGGVERKRWLLTHEGLA
jgi:methylated-DNA-[protein]-cysteine S-methyltransferase